MDLSSLNAFKPGLANVASYAWVLWVLVPIAFLIFGAFMWKNIREKNKQWTHKLRIRKVMKNNLLSREVTIRMRRFPLIKRAEVFELEKAVLGGYLMPELDSYTGTNEFSIIIDTNNRIYVSTGEKFDPDKSCIFVSAKHAEIDIGRSDLRADYTNINKTSKKYYQLRLLNRDNQKFVDIIYPYIEQVNCMKYKLGSYTRIPDIQV